jgi:hypothetical protein
MRAKPSWCFKLIDKLTRSINLVLVTLLACAVPGECFSCVTEASEDVGVALGGETEAKWEVY